MVKKLKQQAVLSKTRFRGTFKQCVPVGRYVLLYGPVDEEDVVLTQEQINKYPDVKIAKILDWEMDEGAGTARGPLGNDLPLGWVAEERAPGIPLGDTHVITQGEQIRDAAEAEEKYSRYRLQLQRYIVDLWNSAAVTPDAMQEFIRGQNFLRDKPLTLDCSHPGNVNYSKRYGLTSFDYSTDMNKKPTSDDMFLANMCDIFLPRLPSFYMQTNGGRLEPESILPPKMEEEISYIHNSVIAPKLGGALRFYGLQNRLPEYVTARLGNALTMEDGDAVEYIKDSVT